MSEGMTVGDQSSNTRHVRGYSKSASEHGCQRPVTHMSLGTAKMPVNMAARDQSPATRHIPLKSKNVSEHGTANDKGARPCVEGRGGEGREGVGRGVGRLFKHCHSHSDGARASKLL